MKRTWYDFIPFYGLFTYFRRYFNTLDKPTILDIRQALWMQYYHVFGTGIFVILIIKFIEILIKHL